MARILFDIDDVLYPCVDTIRDYLVSDYEYTLDELPTPSTWDIHKHWGMSHEKLWNLVSQGVNEGHIFAVGKPIPGSAEAVRSLKDEGHKIHLVTARVGGDRGLSERWTVEWLNDNNIPYDSLTFSQDKTIIPVDFALDDRAENFTALNLHCRAFLMDQPWNQHVRTDYRVHDAQQFVFEVHRAIHARNFGCAVIVW